jgi:hypothetical protein
MKLDKETMIKQRFWFLLPVFALCLLICWICVLGVNGETETNYKAASDKNTALNNLAKKPEIPNTQWIEAMGKEFDVSSAKKLELWQKEYDRQNKVVRDVKDPTKFRRTEPFFTWPERTRSRWMQTSQGRDLYDMDFGEFLGNIPSDEYREEYMRQYQDVVDKIRDWLNETNSSNVTGAVRVLGGRDNHRNYVIPQLLKPHPLRPDKHILSDEIHLLQEDLAVKRELFASLSELLDGYSKLKPEWSEVPFVEIKEVTAPAPPPAPGTIPAAGVEAPPAVPATPDAAALKRDAEVTDRYRFYNYIWPNLLNASEVAQIARLKSTTVDFNLPMTDPYKGWRIDLIVGQDPQDDKKLVLNIVSANHSDLFTIPAIPLMIWYSELGSDQEVATPLFLKDAGELGPCEFWPNATMKKLSQKKLKAISLPANFGKVTRITRMLPDNAVDQQIAFNHDWVVNAQLIRRENNPVLTLRGEIINRSGRRLPVATFIADLALSNNNKPLNEEFKVATDAFNAGERRTFIQEVKNPIQPRSISVLRQKLTWRSTPIKRIDRLELGKTAHLHSDRLKTLPLIAYDFKLKDPLGSNAVAQTSPPAAGAPADASGAGGAPPPAGLDMGGGGKGFGGGGDQGAGVSPNQEIPLDRYIEVTSQLRRMPVAFVMVVDATAVTDIIAAMSNSKLRFQVTMAPWVKVPNLGRPGGSDQSAAGSPGPGSGPGSTPGPGTGPGSAPPAAGGGMGGLSLGGGSGTGGGTRPPAPPMSGKSGGAVGSGSDYGGGQSSGSGSNRPATGNTGAAGMGLEDDSSVVELQIYGLVTIYESPDHFKRIQQLKTNSPTGAGTKSPQ